MSEKIRDFQWNERYACVWYNSDAIFEWADEDFDRKARELRDNEITTVIIYTSTHFRFSFVPWWDSIIRCLERIVESCHRYGIKVIEHASTQLTFDPRNEEDWKTIENRFALFGEKSIYSFPDIKDFLTKDPVLGGTPISSWRQIDGRTGEWQRSPYCGYSLCYNNPDYRRVYFEHLRSIFATGIDGIMNDDLQYYGEACACEHCRRLFKEKTGYDLPASEQWADFYGNYDDPVFVAFLKFRMDSATGFYNDIVALERECGVHMLRPNYISHILLGNWSAYPFESVSHHFSNIFVENIHPSIIRYSFPAFMTEMVHRYALATRNDVPAMSLFYPTRADDIYFSWAFAHTCGHMFTISGLRNQKDLTSFEKKYRVFEQEHAEMYWNPKKLADVAIYLSVTTRDFTAHRRFAPRPWMVWCQAACFSGLQVDMVFEQDSIEVLKKQKMIVLPCVTMLSDDELSKLREYVAGGGKLLLIGECGTLDDKGVPRDPTRMKELMMYDTVVHIDWEHKEELYYNETLKDPSGGKVPFVGNVLSEQQETIGRLLCQQLPGKPQVAVSGNCLAGLYSVKNGYALNVMTIENILPEKPCDVHGTDIIPGYSQGELISENIEVACCITEDVYAVTLWSPSIEEKVAIPFQKTGDVLRFTIPGNTFGGYSLIEITCDV